MRAQEVVWSLWISLNRLYSPRQLTAYKYEFFVKYYDGCFSMKRFFIQIYIPFLQYHDCLDVV